MYLGEILQAVALSLPGAIVWSGGGDGGGYALLQAAAYPLYYVALFIPRQMDDDAQMRAKYGGAHFDEYARRVRYRIVPGVW